MRAITAPFDALVSFHYFGLNQLEALIDEGAAAGIRFIGDSGAFSVMTGGQTIDLRQYADWIGRHQHSLVWAASLDVIGNSEASWANYRVLRREGLPVVPTVHFGCPPSELDRYADDGAALVGLGGMAHRRDRGAVLRWLVSMFLYARDHHPDMRFHGWGLTGRGYLDHLPFWSVDSSGFGSSYIYGRASFWDEGRARFVGVDLDGSTPGKHGRLLREQYGLTPTDIARSSSTNRTRLYFAGFRSQQMMADHYRARHQVEPPHGWEREGKGTHVHLAATAGGIFEALIEHLNAKGAVS